MELLGMRRKARRRRCNQLLQQFDIARVRRSKAMKLSGGERRRLEIARCLVSDPEIIMLDEPFAGIDPVTVQSIQRIIRDLRERGISILITDHGAREILKIVNRCYVISKGRVICHGEPDDVICHDEVRRTYLGDDIDVGSAGPPPPHLPPTSLREAPAARTGRLRGADAGPS
jgi:lipopolysaccharide export system ATP-binding protein